MFVMLLGKVTVTLRRGSLRRADLALSQHRPAEAGQLDGSLLASKRFEQTAGSLRSD
jgi:hypothetical protein